MTMPDAGAAAARSGWRWSRRARAVLIAEGVVLAVCSYFLAPGELPGLHAGEGRGGLEFSWDPSRATVRQARYGVLEVRDGGRVLRLYLDRPQLAEGRLDYARQSEQVEARMRVLRFWGAPVEESVVFVGGLPAAHSQSPEAEALLQAQRERDGLAAEVGRLRQEFQRQRLRAAQMEEANRLLRQRLEIEAARGR